MSSVCEENVECPVCGNASCGYDLNCRTNESELVCHTCGFVSEVRIREAKDGRRFWTLTLELPTTRDGELASLDLPACKFGNKKWTRREFGAKAESPEETFEMFQVEAVPPEGASECDDE
jgi:hypothetical protein